MTNPSLFLGNVLCTITKITKPNSFVCPGPSETRHKSGLINRLLCIYYYSAQMKQDKAATQYRKRNAEMVTDSFAITGSILLLGQGGLFLQLYLILSISGTRLEKFLQYNDLQVQCFFSLAGFFAFGGSPTKIINSMDIFIYLKEADLLYFFFNGKFFAQTDI